MNCHQVATMLDAYVDGELAAVEHQNVQGHLHHCAVCAQKAADLNTLQAALAADTLYHAAPGTLRCRVETALATASSTSFFSQPLSISSSIIISVGLFLVAGALWYTWPIMFSTKPVTVTRQTLDTWQRAREAGTQVAYSNSNAQQVHDWIKAQTRLDIGVHDMARQGFLLQGARVEHLPAADIPVVVYGKDGQSVDVYFWPNHCNSKLLCLEQPPADCHLTCWPGANGVVCWAVSNLSAERFNEFTAAAIANVSTQR